MQIADNENAEYQQFAHAIHAVERTFDFIVIDTPGTDSYVMRLAHLMADTLVTPVNDSFLDLDVLGTVDPATSAVTGVSHYAELVRDTRRNRRRLDGATADWGGAQPSLDVWITQQASRRRRLERIVVPAGFSHDRRLR